VTSGTTVTVVRAQPGATTAPRPQIAPRPPIEVRAPAVIAVRAPAAIEVPGPPADISIEIVALARPLVEAGPIAVRGTMARLARSPA
jgi:hypothetical protein